MAKQWHYSHCFKENRLFACGLFIAEDKLFAALAALEQVNRGRVADVVVLGRLCAEGASEGAGLGHLFLRHLSRTRVLLHLVDVSSADPDLDVVAKAAADARAIVEELRLYDISLFEKPRWLVLNKLDMVDDPESVKQQLVAELDWKGPVYSISALTGDGTQELVLHLQSWLDAERHQANIEQDKADGSYVTEDPRFDDTRSNPE